MRTWLPEHAPGTSVLEQTLGLRPDLGDPFRSFYAVFWRDRLVDPLVLELCRLRVAQLLGCSEELGVRYQAAIDGGLDEQMVERLAQWPTDAAFSEIQRAALAFTEQFVIDPHGIRGAIRDTLREHFTLPELVALTEALALFDGFARFRMVLGTGEIGAVADIAAVDPTHLDAPLP